METLWLAGPGEVLRELEDEPADAAILCLLLTPHTSRDPSRRQHRPAYYSLSYIHCTDRHGNRTLYRRNADIHFKYLPDHGLATQDYIQDVSSL